MTVTPIIPPSFETFCPSPAQRAASDGTAISSFDPSLRVSPDLNASRAVSCYESSPIAGGAGRRLSDSPPLLAPHLLTSGSLTLSDGIARLHIVKEAHESLLETIKALGDQFFKGCGLIKIGESLEVSPTDKENVWQLRNKHIETVCTIPRFAASVTELQSHLTIVPAEYSRVLPEDSDALKLDLKSQMRDKDSGYILIDHEAGTQIYAVPGDIIHVFCEKDKMGGPITLKFASGLVLFTKSLEKGYTIFDASQRKEPYHRSAKKDLQEALNAFISRAFKQLQNKPLLVEASLADVFAARREMIHIQARHEDIYALKITNKSTESVERGVGAPAIVEVSDEPTFLCVQPYFFSESPPTKEELKELGERLEASQNAGERAYFYEPYNSMCVYSFPDNTITIVSKYGYTKLNLKLTFADGTTLFTKDVIQGVSHYKIGSLESDRIYLVPSSFIQTSYMPTDPTTQKVRDELVRLEDKKRSFEEKGHVVTREEPYAYTVIYSFPDNTITVSSRFGYNDVNLKLTFADGTAYMTQGIVQGVAHYKIPCKIFRSTI